MLTCQTSAPAPLLRYGQALSSSGPVSVLMPGCFDHDLQLNAYGLLLVPSMGMVMVVVVVLLYFGYYHGACTPASCTPVSVGLAGGKFCELHTCQNRACPRERKRGHTFCGGARCTVATTREREPTGQLASRTGMIRLGGSVPTEETGLPISRCRHVGKNAQLGIAQCMLPVALNPEKVLRAVCVFSLSIIFFFLC